MIDRTKMDEIAYEFGLQNCKRTSTGGSTIYRSWHELPEEEGRCVEIHISTSRELYEVRTLTAVVGKVLQKEIIPFGDEYRIYATLRKIRNINQSLLTETL